ncbi:MAG: hypothetical protein N4A61_05640 [Pelagimonas sp.]|jgi:hypothetical protein|nr:hypothetical protein [Pelagimonas sp.]
MKLRFLALAALGMLALAGCSNNYSGPMATPDQAAAAAYRHDGPPALTLYTMINNRSGTGAHTSLMINAPSQRVIFDPAGTVILTSVPEINDVLFGVTPQVQRIYESAHARETFHVRIQRLEVPGPVAERALALARSTGKVAGAQCAAATARILAQLPGLEGIGSTLFPNKLADNFAKIPGVTETKRVEHDSDDKDAAVIEMEAALNAQTPTE